MAFLAAAAPAIISAGASIGANALMNSGSTPTAASMFAPPGINSGGLDIKFKKGQYKTTASPDRLGLVNNVSGLFGNEADMTSALRARVAPGISDLRASRLAEIENARHAAVGNLRDNLARRRVLGSSFGTDAIARAESEFAGQRDRVAAESFLQELELTNQLTNQEFNQRRAVFNTKLDELNLEANLAVNLAGKATDALAKNAQIDAQLAAQSAAGQGRFVGQTLQPAFNAIGNSVGGLFSGGGGGLGNSMTNIMQGAG